MAEAPIITGAVLLLAFALLWAVVGWLASTPPRFDCDRCPATFPIWSLRAAHEADHDREDTHHAHR